MVSQEAIARSQEGIRQHEEFVKMTEEAESFLGQAEETLEACSEPSGDMSACEDKLQDSEVGTRRRVCVRFGVPHSGALEARSHS